MADEELESILGEEAPPVEPTAEAKVQEPSPEEQAIAARKLELENLDKAKAQALAELSDIRAQKRQLKKDPEELPQIDFTDPSAKAWDNRIKETVSPVESELEKARE